jgi:hypothetical protein
MFDQSGLATRLAGRLSWSVPIGHVTELLQRIARAMGRSVKVNGLWLAIVAAPLRTKPSITGNRRGFGSSKRSGANLPASRRFARIAVAVGAGRLVTAGVLAAEHQLTPRDPRST